MSDQFYPTLKLSNSDKSIALQEYISANDVLKSEIKLFSLTSNIVALLLPFTASLFIWVNSGKSINLFSNHFYIFSIFSILVFSTFTSLNSIAQKIRDIVYAKRKIIILRRILGMSYGASHLILPNWRLEGADQPHSIKVFNGWLDYSLFPLHLICLFSSFFLMLIINASFIEYLEKDLLHLVAFHVSAIYLLILLIFIRLRLYEDHDKFFLILVRDLQKVIPKYLSKTTFVKNFEYIIYRAKLSTIETNRLGINIKNLEKWAVLLEDKTFHQNSGISYRSLARAIYFRITRGKRSGGSTITMQLARSLFIPTPNTFLTRKIYEFFLAKWMTSVFTKKQILEMYICSVRYENHVLGATDAMKYFFGELYKNPGNVISFFLIERISNINSNFLGDKVYLNIKNALDNGQIRQSEVSELLKLYENQISERKIKMVKGKTLKQIANLLNV